LSGKGKRRVKPQALVDDLLDVLCRCGANRPGSRMTALRYALSGAALAVESFTMAERDGLLWLWLGDTAKARMESIPDIRRSSKSHRTVIFVAT